ncbi:hypothetical protein THAOC_10075 [Thalassiosira oceanica]|uniref:Uncharacterized protein n=1 Tax=Thalassiosira oceanica TaxID=159749 RepID=K0STM2_THAOC|nr:hypothetical protein THAOC_10075 [Thalassiosira oceanica]|eukprot:EJK68720.1 hypothetical protein THAOC_10075 [Thalassiosira oceanica]
MSRLVSFAKTPMSFMSRLLTPSKSSGDGAEQPQVPRTPPSGTSEAALGASQLSSAKRTYYSAQPSTEWVSSQQTKHGVRKSEELPGEDIFEGDGLEDVFNVSRDDSGRRIEHGRDDSTPASILDEYKTSGGVTLEHVQEQVALQTRTGLLDTPTTSKDKYQIKIDATEITLDNATGRLARDDYRSLCLWSLLSDALFAIFGRAKIKKLIKSARYSVLGVEVETRKEVVIGPLLLCLVLDEMRAPALEVVDKLMNDFNEFTIKKVDKESPALLLGELQDKAELVSKAANKTKLDETDIAARFKNACLKGTNKRFVQVVEKQWAKVEKGKKTLPEFYEKVRDEYRRLNSSTVEDDETLGLKQIALVTESQKDLKKKLQKIEEKSRSSKQSKDKSGGKGAKDGAWKDGHLVDRHGFKLSHKTTTHVEHPSTGKIMTWTPAGEGVAKARYYAAGYMPVKAWMRLSEEEKIAANPRYKSGPGKENKSSSTKTGNGATKRGAPSTPTSKDGSAKKTPQRMQVKHSFITRAVCKQGMSEDDASKYFDDLVWPEDKDDATDGSSKE